MPEQEGRAARRLDLVTKWFRMSYCPAGSVAALRGELAEEWTARRIAELGLQTTTLEAERLQVQIGRLRHEGFGRSSERLPGEVEQLELRLDNVLANIVAAGGATQ